MHWKCLVIAIAIAFICPAVARSSEKQHHASHHAHLTSHRKSHHVEGLAQSSSMEVVAYDSMAAGRIAVPIKESTEMCLQIEVPTPGIVTVVLAAHAEFVTSVGLKPCEKAAREASFYLTGGVRLRFFGVGLSVFVKGTVILEAEDAPSHKQMLQAFGRAFVAMALKRGDVQEQINAIAVKQQTQYTAMLAKFESGWTASSPLKAMMGLDMARVHVSRDLSAWLKTEAYGTILGWNAASPLRVDAQNPAKTAEVKQKLLHFLKRLGQKLTELILKYFYGYDKDYSLFECSKASAEVNVKRFTAEDNVYLDPIIRPNAGVYSPNPLNKSPHNLPGIILCNMVESTAHSIFTESPSSDYSDPTDPVISLTSLFMPQVVELDPTACSEISEDATTPPVHEPTKCPASALKDANFASSATCSLFVPLAAANIFMREFHDISSTIDVISLHLLQSVAASVSIDYVELLLRGSFKDGDFSVYPASPAIKTYRDWSFESWRAVKPKRMGAAKTEDQTYRRQNAEVFLDDEFDVEILDDGGDIGTEDINISFPKSALDEVKASALVLTQVHEHSRSGPLLRRTTGGTTTPHGLVFVEYTSADAADLVEPALGPCPDPLASVMPVTTDGKLVYGDALVFLRPKLDATTGSLASCGWLPFNSVSDIVTLANHQENMMINRAVKEAAKDTFEMKMTATLDLSVKLELIPKEADPTGLCGDDKGSDVSVEVGVSYEKQIVAGPHVAAFGDEPAKKRFAVRISGNPLNAVGMKMLIQAEYLSNPSTISLLVIYEVPEALMAFPVLPTGSPITAATITGVDFKEYLKFTNGLLGDVLSAVATYMANVFDIPLTDLKLKSLLATAASAGAKAVRSRVPAPTAVVATEVDKSVVGGLTDTNAEPKTAKEKLAPIMKKLVTSIANTGKEQLVKYAAGKVLKALGITVENKLSSEVAFKLAITKDPTSGKWGFNFENTYAEVKFEKEAAIGGGFGGGSAGATFTKGISVGLEYADTTVVGTSFEAVEEQVHSGGHSHEAGQEEERHHLQGAHRRRN